jgi:T-complex protein 1 subunit gamma
MYVTCGTYGVIVQTFKTTIEATCMLLKIDDNMNDIKKKKVSSYAPKQPQIDIEVNVDSEQMILK